jgi:DNA-binding NarL/FixJ family response regulator
MAEGATNADIADRPALSLGVTNRTAALVRAQELGLV